VGWPLRNPSGLEKSLPETFTRAKLRSQTTFPLVLEANKKESRLCCSLILGTRCLKSVDIFRRPVAQFDVGPYVMVIVRILEETCCLN
jgi:hypothetical protein